MPSAAQPTARRRTGRRALTCTAAAVPALALIAAPTSTAAAPEPTSTQVPHAQVPTGLVSRNQGNAIVLNWDPPTDRWTKAYEVVENGKVVARNDTTTARISSLPLGSQHTYRVRALDGTNRPTALSAPVTDSVAPPRGIVMRCQDVPVTGLVAGGVTPTGLTLAWTDPLLTDPSYDTFPWRRTYSVYDGSTRLAQSSTGRSLHLAGLAPASKHTLTVQVPGCEGSTVASAALTVSTPEGVIPPPSPSDVTATQVDDETLDVAWSAPSDTSRIDHFAVYLDGRRAWTGPTSLVTRATLTGLAWGETYDVAVVAVGTAGNESTAARRPVSLLTCRSGDIHAPRLVTATAATASSVVVTWAQDSQPDSTAILVDGETAAVVSSLGTARITGLAAGQHTIVVDPQMPVRDDLCADAPASAPVTVTLGASSLARPHRPGTPTATLDFGPTFLSSTATLTWTGSPSPIYPKKSPNRVVGYRVYDDAGKRRAASKTTSATLVVQAGTTTNLRVVAVAASGLESPASATIAVHDPGPLVP